MSELTKLVRGGFTEDCNYTGDPSLVQDLCLEHECLEAMLRAWHAARGDDESEAAIELWREACRLVEKPT